ncbi:zinc-binding dehydrogenase [Parvularcula sp. ZS-1/3]|uniref:Zinc-binding dehydrogenase n=1 Tax=Parvularcula mediterranea TaxID=2732508 RepID=A0A7Y3RKF4_9PROT|nr:zinc-binding dehydrogenase [Parvularcula mediterranea]NNU15693.1 zinc-binding dehydrogenase [Parvularcula mediterranea]
MADIPATMRRIVSEAKSNGTLEVRIEEVPTPKPEAGQVLVKIEAAPINPSDLALLLSMTDASQAKSVDATTTSLPIPDFAMRMLQGRMDEAMPVGNEGSGTVVAAGDAAGEGLVGKLVAAAGGDMFAEYRCVPVAMCMPMPEGVSARDAASSFVNPMTALSMTKVMKRDGSPALVHTAAASNLGQMLQRICKADGIPLINIVRKPEQRAILKDLGADYALNSEDGNFMADLVEACAETGAIIGFDAVGGGDLSGRIITAMEAAQSRKLTEYSRYGTSVHKQMYVYGRLDLGEVRVPPSVGMAWGVGGFLLTNFLATISPEERMGMAMRIATEIKTTFASDYTGEISLDDVLKPDVMAKYNAKATGTKYLIKP